MKNRTMKYWQKRIFILCWLAYTIAYLGRLNLSIAIPLMEDSLTLDKTSLGFIGSLFFWAYAFGQLINGRLGDKFASRSFVFWGLLISSILNLLFGSLTSLIFMAILWAFNGYFQSMLWGPLMKTINLWFPQKQSSKMALYMFSSVVSGFLLVWGGLGQISSYTGWKGVFRIPGIILLIYSFIWYICMRNKPEEVGLCLEDTEISSTKLDLTDTKLNYTQIEPTENKLNYTEYVLDTESGFDEKGNKSQRASFMKLIFKTRLYLIALASIPLGFIREGISLWAPTMLLEIFQLNLKSTMGAALLIPLFNFMGVVVARLIIIKFQDNETKLVAIFFTGGILTCVLLYFFKDSNIIVYLVLLAVCSLCLYAASSILTSVIPQKYHMTSSVAGFLDFSIYLGAGLSGIITGFLSNRIGWNIVILLWIIVGIAGCICIRIKPSKRLYKTSYDVFAYNDHPDK